MKLPNELTATEAARLIAAKKLTAEALTRTCLERIAEREPTIGAWQHLDADAAIARACEIDRGPDRGLLHGLPLAVKDFLDTSDMPTTYGSAIYAGHRPRWDAACVALARSAGAVILGKSVSTEFAMFQPGKTANPVNPAHTPGGSSSGSAAAVSDAMVPLAFGTQTAGSIIRPAAFCGIVGYKPSYGTVPRAGVKLLSESLDTIGALARSVPDCALLAAAVSGRPALAFSRPLDRPPRVGLCRTFQWGEIAPETAEAIEAAAKTLARAGAAVKEVGLPTKFAGLVSAQIDILNYESARSLAWEWHFHRDGLSPRLQEILQAGLQCTAQRYEAAQSLAFACRQMLDEVFEDHDVLLAPSAKGEAPRGLDATGDPLLNRIWTLLHTPCVHVPFERGPNGLPLGAQVIGRIGGDVEMLPVADWIHRHLA